MEHALLWSADWTGEQTGLNGRLFMVHALLWSGRTGEQTGLVRRVTVGHALS